MDPDSLRDALTAYAAAIRADCRASPRAGGEGAQRELLLAPRFRALVEAMVGPLGPRVLAEYVKPGIGRPDLAFARPGQPARAFIELKLPDAALDPARLRGHDADQFRRFRELPLWGYCNFHTIRLFRRGEPADRAGILPAAALDPETADATAERLIRQHDPSGFAAIVETLARADPPALRSAGEIAAALAHAARLVREVVADQCRAGEPPALAAVRADFDETLFAHPAAGGYETGDAVALFANAFAQTLAFGLLLAREAEGRDIDRDAYRLLPDGAYPLLRATLRALTQDEILDLLGAGFDVLRDTVNAADPALLGPRDGVDPILYFYEDFLGVFDPAAKRRHGVFFTPVPVVRFMVAAAERALRGSGAEGGLLDPSVLLLDPACGTGTFLIAAAAAARAAAEARFGAGAVAAEMSALAGRLHGLELLVGPYTVAHYRLLRELVNAGAAPAGRLPVYLADTLTPPGGARGVTAHLGFLSAPIVAERMAADALKDETPILAILGNPPYRRLNEGEERAITRPWDNGFWDDLKKPVRDAGWGNELNTFPDLYIAFWRWCLWKLFEAKGAPGRGVVCLITNRGFLSGHPYAGLRKLLRERFDTIDIVDLRGDLRGARPAGIAADQNVFAIRAGVAITIAVARGGRRRRGAEAVVRYADPWRQGAFASADKLALLERAARDPAALAFLPIDRHGLEDFLPVPFAGLDWPAITELFGFRSSGIETQRDDFVYAFDDGTLRDRVARLRAEPADAAGAMFRATRGRSPADAARARWLPDAIADVAYRPLDRRRLYAKPEFVDFIRPTLQACWGHQNRALFALPFRTGAGPAVWVHGLPPDRHAFRGSFGGYAFPLWDRREGPAACNLAPDYLAAFGRAYGRAATPDRIFDAVTALLSAPAYSRRFAWDLEESFAQLPLPSDPALFARAARIGAEIAALESFARAPAERFQSAKLQGRASAAVLAVPKSQAFRSAGGGAGSLALLADRSLCLDGLPEAVWTFAVSGYEVLPRFLAAREGEALDAALQRAILDVAWRIEALLYWFAEADSLLEAALAAPLTRACLGIDRLTAPSARRKRR